MKVFQINIFGNLRTGRIAVDIYHLLKETNEEGIIAFARNEIEPDVDHYKIGNKLNIYIDAILTRLTDKAGHFSIHATKKLIEFIDQYKPDVIHLHNIHGYYINVPILFSYLKKSNIPIVWTLHDCWAFTGHCCHFSAIKCDRWKTQCYNCPQKHSYPASFIDHSKGNYLQKKQLFTGIRDMYIVTVSKWLEGVTRQSYLGSYPIVTIYNGIDTSVFKPIKSNIKADLGIENHKIILGVASTWSINKGLKDFIELNKLITSNYIIVLVGLNKQQINDLPNNMIGLSRTQNINELVKLYSAAEVFFNASIEETFGLPTLEAMACGTPVVVYNCTALPEIVNEDTGKIVEVNNVKQVWKIIQQISRSSLNKEKLIANAKKYEKNCQYQQYLNLYKKIVNKECLK